jgi:hypothetical protein
VDLTEHKGGIASVVARCWLILFVGCVVLLIDDDETDVSVGQK